MFTSRLPVARHRRAAAAASVFSSFVAAALQRVVAHPFERVGGASPHELHEAPDLLGPKQQIDPRVEVACGRRLDRPLVPAARSAFGTNFISSRYVGLAQETGLTAEDCRGDDAGRAAQAGGGAGVSRERVEQEERFMPLARRPAIWADLRRWLLRRLGREQEALESA